MIKPDIILEGPDDIMEAFIAAARKGDPRCPIAVGSRVVKVAEETPGEERNRIGSRGTVTASWMVPEKGPAYLVKYDGFEVETLNLGFKLALI